MTNLYLILYCMSYSGYSVKIKLSSRQSLSWQNRRVCNVALRCATSAPLRWVICLIIAEFGVRSPRSMQSLTPNTSNKTKGVCCTLPQVNEMICNDSVPPWAEYHAKHWLPAFLLLAPADVDSSHCALLDCTPRLPPSSPPCLQHLCAAACLGRVASCSPATSTGCSWGGFWPQLENSYESVLNFLCLELAWVPQDLLACSTPHLCYRHSLVGNQCNEV